MAERNDQAAEQQIIQQDEEPVSEMEAAVVHLLSVAVVCAGYENGVSVFRCKLCGQLDEAHLSNCPVPALEEWLNPAES